jgi:hypothetical protein
MLSIFSLSFFTFQLDNIWLFYMSLVVAVVV